MKKILFIFNMLWSLPTQAYFYRASLWSVPGIKNEKYVMVCHDAHNYSVNLNKNQIDAFEEIIPTCLNNMHLILENQPASVQEYRNKNLFNACAELKELCEKHAHKIENADYRDKRGRSYYKCLKASGFTAQDQYDALNKDLMELGCTTQALAQEFYDTWQPALQNIECLVEQSLLSPQVAAMLKECCTTIHRQWESELDKWKKFEGTLLEYCQSNQCFTAEYLAQALTFDRSLLDIKLLLSLLSSDNKLIIVAAGGAHCHVLEYFLRCIECSLIDSQGIDIAPEDNDIKVPADLPASQIPKYLMTADKIFTVRNIELLPVTPNFFQSLTAPEVYAQNFTVWGRATRFINFLKKAFMGVVQYEKQLK